MKKMTTCKSCGAEIAKSAKVCPNCGAKNKKPIFKRWWVWLIVVVLIFAAIGSCEDSGTTNEKGQSSSQVEQDQQKEEVQENKEPELTEDEYKAACVAVPYENLARDPDSYRLEKVQFYGQIVQVIDGNDGSVELRVNTSNDGYGWYDDTIYVSYQYKEGELRLLEDDLISVYGTSQGLLSYTSTLGGKITIPSVNAKYIDRT